MTKQIEQAYRNNRRRSWLLIAAVVAIAAVIAIPIASGTSNGSGKYYTLGSNKSVCVGDTGVSVPLTLTNKANQSLGSANITFPGYVTVTGTTPGTRVGNLIKLRNVNLAKNASLNFTVTVTVNNVGASRIEAVVKQSNDFNGSDGSNLFELLPGASLPVLTAENCFGTISGQVWNDQNENKTRDEAFEVAQNTWSVRLYKKVGGTYGTTPVRTSPTTFNANGAYTFENVPLNSDYLVCEEAAGADAAKEWHQTTELNNSTACRTSKALNEKNGWEIAPFAASVTGKNFGNAWSTTVDTCGGFEDSNPLFTVAGGDDDNCKSTGPTSAQYVYEKWTEGGIQYAAFHPVSGDGVCVLTGPAGSCTYFVQKLTWVFQGTTQPDPADRSLNYDDRKNGAGLYEFEAMKYCQKDPRNGTELGLAPLGTPADVAADVLPTGGPRADGDAQSSCLITSSESTTDTTGEISRVDLVFTAVDGRSAMG